MNGSGRRGDERAVLSYLYSGIRRKLLFDDASCVDRCMHAERVLTEEKKEGRGRGYLVYIDRASREMMR